MRRAYLLLAGAVVLAACQPVRPPPVVPSASPDVSPPTATAFLPRGFAGLPSEAVTAQGSASGGTATATLDLSMAVERLTRLRAESGAPPLLSSPALDRIARERAEAMAEAASLSHTLAAGTALEADLTSAGFGGRVAEVALSIPSDDEDSLGMVLQALLTDPANRRALLDPAFRLAGFGSSVRDGTRYVVGILAQDGPPE